MALNDTLKTRILLRNDTLANWESSNLVLGKGEVAIATLAGGELAEVRVGTGSSTWATALKLNVNADQISGLVDVIEGTAKKYQVVVNGEGGNSWKLQEAALSGGAWTDVAGSTWTVDFSAINDQITALTADVDSIKTDLAGAKTALNTVSSDYVKATDFAALSNEIGLSAASASNPVVTKNDIADLAGAMHFKGAVASLAEIQSAEPGDVVIIPSTSKEYVYTGEAEAAYSIDNWVELGDEVLYATKAEVATISGELTSDIADITADVDYLSDQIDATNATLNTVSSDYLKAADKTALETLVGTTSAETLVSANAYADSKFAGLSDYYTKDEVDAISTALSTDYSGKIKAVDDKLADYALSADVTSGIAAAKSEVIGEASDLSSADTINGAKAYAKNYTDEAVAGLSVDNFIKHGECVQSDLSGFFVLDCGGSALREDEPTA